MIGTILFVMKQVVQIAKEHFFSNNNDTIDLIETSNSQTVNMTDSMVVFSNCERINLPAKLNDANNNTKRSKGISWQQCRYMREKRKKENRGLMSNRKMESEEGACRASFGGAVVSPRTKPVSPRGVITSPESDCNSNNLTLPSDNPLYCSNDSTQDGQDFIQDNSDYQWFLDYGYRENTNHHQSILSLSASHELGYYDDMARNLDANLAEVDMEDFHREDIHTILSTLPNMCCNDMQGVEEREMFASVSGSMMVKFDFDSSLSPHTSSQEENTNSMSVCKSELLFSPVRESYLPTANLSVDSLDLSENDINIMVTCQANKNNYTIAFEGSTIMGSDDSECPETGESGETTSEENLITHYRKEQQQHKNNQQILRHIDNSMARSDSMYTTWSKLKQRSSEHLQLRRHPSGNNNTTQTDTTQDSNNINNSNTVKSLSLPNLFRQKQRNMLGLSVSSKLSSEMGSSLENDQHCIKLYDIQKSNTSESSADRSSSSAAGKPQDRPHNFSLVKLFIKQKSASHEGMCNYSMDQSSASECWEESNTASDIKGNERMNNFSKQNCSCHLSNQSNGMKVLKNNWTNGNKRHNEDCSLGCFEDSLVSKNMGKNERVQEREISDSESVEQISESLKQISESVEQITESCNDSTHLTSNAFDESSHKIKNINNAYAFNVNNNNSYLGSKKSKYSSDSSTQENGSNTESAENLPCNCKKASQEYQSKKSVMEKSIQTSKLIENEATDKKQLKVPVYILYPNYSLPNLEFLKEKHYVQNIDFSKIFLRPQKFEAPPSPMTNINSPRMRPGSKRPFSVNDIESLKKTGFKHVKDWDSLTFLLPREYKQFLQEIPEIVAQLKDIKNAKEDLKPLFCLSPPPTRHVKKRPTSCDSNFFSGEGRCSNFSSTATQPSSGYRGSSTMLNSNNSNATPSPKNPSFAYRYDSISSESASSRRSGPRSPSVMNSDSTDEIPARPPLPRSILRNSSLDNPKYTCKTQKENANKRYSMIELSEKNSDANDKFNKRKSMQDPYYLTSSGKNKDLKKKPSRSNKNTETFEVSNDENVLGKPSMGNDMRRLEELLEISMVFGESIESFTENDMSKLRNQVSKFLTMQKNLEKVSETLQNVNDKKISETYDIEKDGDMFEGKRLLDVKYSQTPNNTPEHRKKPPLAVGEEYESDLDNSMCVECGFNGKNCSCARIMPCSDCGQEGCDCKDDSFKGLKKTVSFAEKISFLMKEQELKFKGLTPPNSPNISSLLTNQKPYQCKSKRWVDVPICEESFEGTPGGSPSKNTPQPTAHLLYKRDLVMDVKKAVEKIVAHSKSDYDNKQEELANLCLHRLCPSLYAILSDGLKEQITTQFGPIRNSVWTVVEASSQQGPMTQTLNELVQRLNRDDVLSEGLVKFNAFVFGLLNVHALDAWFSYLRTRDSLLRKYYDNSGLLVLSNSAGAPVRVLMDQLTEILEPLTTIEFNLDLLYQAKLLHSSLLNLNTLLETNNDMLSPTKHIMLLKLVQSIQNSITHSSDGKKGKSTSEDIESLTTDPPVTHLLEKSVTSRTSHGNTKPRPRSGCDNIGQGNDVASTVNKRWSGIQLNSKLLQAFERLGEETESDYTDSLENPRFKREREKGSSSSSSPSKNFPKRLQSSDDTSDDISHTWTKDSISSENKTKEQRKYILSNLNKKNAGRIEENKTDVNAKEVGLDQSITQMQSGGHKFKRLQQRWELLSGKSASDSSGSNTPSQVMSPSHRSKIPTTRQPEKSHCDSNATTPSITTPSPTSSKVSKIPRLVTSPVSCTAPPARQNVTSKKLVSPTSCTNQTVPYRGVRSANTKISAGNRLSRCDDKSENSGAHFGRNHAVRPTSLPYRNTNTMPSKKSVQIPPRASSMSLNRRPASAKLQQNTQKTVRTLTHRLPSDSGHLSFNEGEKLKVVLEVDETWLLCCRGTQKGLVPKSAVIAVPDHTRF